MLTAKSLEMPANDLLRSVLDVGLVLERGLRTGGSVNEESLRAALDAVRERLEGLETAAGWEAERWETNEPG
jgi:hypothetical protein